MLSRIIFLASVVNAAVHTIDVGEKGLTFDPQTVKAASGDVLVFHLYPGHDVVQGSFSSPCMAFQGGFYSGQYSSTDSGKKKFVVNVTSDDTIYFYCSITGHCQGGMVGGVNLPSSGDTIEAYASAAQNAKDSETPQNASGGELLEDEQIASLTAGASASTSGSETTSAPSASGSPSASGAGTTGGSSATPSSTPSPSAQSTGAAHVNKMGEASGMLAVMLGFAAWYL